MKYQVVWPKMNLFNPEGEATVYPRGAILPDGADDEQMSRLVTIGAVQIVSDAPQDPASVPSLPPVIEPNPGNDSDDDLVKPARDATKEDWVDYASDERNPDRIPESQARAMSKADLVRKYGG